MNNNTEDLVKLGENVLHHEAQALLDAAKKIDKKFSQALDLLNSTKGRVIVCGMGKSGHVGRKIAASFASTGTAAYYLHPSEALHGDSGVMTSSDCILFIAYSGETYEVIKLAQFAKSKNIPVISICGNLNSRLVVLSDVYLDGSVSSEADPFNIVPTTSSTLALALGDALVVCLMKLKNFGIGDFAGLHPEGKLGRMLSEVENQTIKQKELFIGCLADFESVLHSITKNTFGIIGVVDENQNLVGAITDGDLRRAILKNKSTIFELKAQDLMTSSPKVISHNSRCQEALQIMRQYKITSLFVTNEDNKSIGIIRLQDISFELPESK